MNKIVVLTGSFNPVTKAHFEALQAAVNKVNADKGMFVLTNKDYLRKKMLLKTKIPTSFILSEEERKEMIDSLSEEDPRLVFGGFELGKESPSTEKTLRKIAKENPGSIIYYLSGADKLKSIPNWKDFDSLMTNMRILVIKRKDIDIDSIINNDPRLLKYKDNIEVMDELEGLKDVSSSELRRYFFENEDYSHLMNPGPYKIMRRYEPKDFPLPPRDEIIKAHLELGGRYGGNGARMAVFKDNRLYLMLGWSMNKDFYNKNEETYHNTKLYKNKFAVKKNLTYRLRTSVVNMDCADVAETLIKEGCKPAILNSASPLVPCGSYSKGGNSLEESLCQMSTLPLSLYQFANPNLKIVKDVHIPHKKGYPLDTPYSGVYSKGITFFRNNLDKQYRLRNNLFKCDIVSVASLANCPGNEYTIDGMKYFDETGHLNAEGKEIERDKIRTIFRIALDNGNDSLVLGAFGCGAYNCLPEDIAKLFEEVLKEEEFFDAFSQIVFAIYEGKPSPRSKKVVGENGKYHAFYETFNK